jgi:hypothetical protein
MLGAQMLSQSGEQDIPTRITNKWRLILSAGTGVSDFQCP